ITLTVFVNSGSGVAFGNGLFSFGDGSSPLLVPDTEVVNRPDLGPNIGEATFTVEHAYPAPGRYIIGYTEANRNGGIINFDNSLSTTFYIETIINLDPFLGAYHTPEFLIDPFLLPSLEITFRYPLAHSVRKIL
ncbi:hypothetical protein QQ054_07525, partial [Oscillatoria amoena NRMC-F 0135]|nr:hypothetical protein [Oscillatoria amoena NRMC-F 0135]